MFRVALSSQHRITATASREGATEALRWAGAVVLLILLVLPPTSPGAPPTAHDPIRVTATPRVLPAWDPLVGSSTHHVPRFDVRSIRLAGARPSYFYDQATWLGYDSADRSFWVAVPPRSVDVVNDSTPYGNVVTGVDVGQSPFGVAADNATNEVFVTNTASDNVTVISGANDTVVGWIGVGGQPTGVAVDPRAGRVYVANSASDNVSVIQVSSRTVLASVDVGSDPVGVACDPASGQVFVADHGSYAVSVISASTDKVVATLPVGTEPDDVAVDTAADRVYVSDEGSSNLSVLDGATDRSVTSIPVLTAEPIDLQGIAYDNRTGELWVAGGRGYLVVVNATAENVSTVYTTDPSGVALDTDRGIVCVTNSYDATFQCLGPAAPAPDTTKFSFTETGLPSGAVWNVTVNNGSRVFSSNHSSTSVQVSAFAETGTPFYFRFGPWDGLLPSPLFAVVSIASYSTPVAVSYSRSATVYSVRFDQTGLPAGTGWNVIMGGNYEQSTGGSLNFSAPNGSYVYVAGDVPNYVNARGYGTVQVNAAPSLVSFAFNLSLSPVGFNVGGLPSTVPWYVNFTRAPAGVTPMDSGKVFGGNVELYLANGSYAYTVQCGSPGYTTESSPGTVEVFGNIPVVWVNFTAVPYSFVFTETGLASGTNWSVNVTQEYLSSTSAQIAFSLAAGSYSFGVEAIPGYRATPSSGTITVQPGGTNTRVIDFVSTTEFPVTFRESGLPLGTGWVVVIGAQSQSSLTSNLSFLELNGSYGYVILPVDGYTTNFSGLVDVAGGPVNVTVLFVPQTFPVIVVEFGLPTGTTWNATVTDASTGFNDTYSTRAAAIIFYLPNGTYTLSVSVPNGYTANVTNGTFTVAGRVGQAPTVHVSPAECPGCSRGTGSNPALSGQPWEFWLGLGALIGVVAAAAALLLVRRERSRRPPAPWSHEP
ncbi:MAG TPA: YncE family protein [Thermoplasmata archaeon]|nr:YncE family protein [Thermoplasmata archaeon]